MCVSVSVYTLKVYTNKLYIHCIYIHISPYRPMCVSVYACVCVYSVCVCVTAVGLDEKVQHIDSICLYEKERKCVYESQRKCVGL